MTVPLQEFAQLVAADGFDVARAAMHVAQDAYPQLDVDVELARFDEIAATIRGRLAADAFAEQKIAALNHHLFTELGFRGNADDYYDARNSYLNDVLERRRGIPITLSVLYMEVARRIGLPIAGVSFPGHFLVKVRLRRGELVLDPFSGGAPQSTGELRERLARVLPPTLAASADLHTYLEPATPRDILARILRNLKAVHLRNGDAERALAVMNRMLLVLPDSAEELRDRGAIYADMGAFRAALEDFRSYLRRRPGAADAIEVRERVVELQGACARLN
jgi:regulator of sirC expression with transglutaminase-like and TPR domain